MCKNENYISFQELTKAVGCSYSTLRNKHIPKIISIYGIDRNRMPTRSLLPLKACEAYFGIKLQENNKKTR